MTNLNQNTSEELQIANYGIGGRRALRRRFYMAVAIFRSLRSAFRFCACKLASAEDCCEAAMRADYALIAMLKYCRRLRIAAQIPIGT